MFDVSKDEELKDAFSWKKTQPLLEQVHRQKSTKFNFLDSQETNYQDAIYKSISIYQIK